MSIPDAPCEFCGWTGPATQYLGIERREITHPTGPHPKDWLPRLLRAEELSTPDEAQGREHCLNCGERIWAGQLKAEYVGRGLVHQNCSLPYGYKKES